MRVSLMSAKDSVYKAEAAGLQAETWVPPRQSGGRVDPLSHGQPVERPVFVARRPWRQRAVASTTVAAGALLLLWLAAIIAGALGFGHLGALPLLGGGEAATPTAEGQHASGQARRQAPALTRAGAGTSQAPAARRERRARAAAPLPAESSRSLRSPSSRRTASIERGTAAISIPQETTAPPAQAPERKSGSASAPHGISAPGAAPGEAVHPSGTGPASGGSSSSHSAASNRPAVTPSGREIPDTGVSASTSATGPPEITSGNAQGRTTSAAG